MLSLPGSPALSPFRLDKLLSALRARDSDVTGVAARWVHLVDALRALADGERQVLDRLLTYGPRFEPGDQHGALILIVPRPGTVSPWSSKATDIAHVCGLSAIRRIERGIAYHVRASKPLARASLERLAPALFVLFV
jgi:phosphoribosylformylglycinamidine synthase